MSASPINIIPAASKFYAAFVKDGKYWKQLSVLAQLSKREALLDIKYWAQSAPASMNGQAYQFRIVEVSTKVLKSGRVRLLRNI